ncbi:MAG: hypothetical protein H6751_18500 [Candidatus Omnitrophica bacterium]|nr:hypothetical protein [Candidatus Omnitrophota bacterium]
MNPISTERSPKEYLQRILPGLPVRVRRIEGQRLQVAHRDSGKPVLILPMLGEGNDSCDKVFEATLEVFEGDRRLSREEIEPLVDRSHLLKEHRQKRLVLDHTDHGDPFGAPDWRSSEIEIAKRPTLSRNLGERDWRLAQAMACEEVRVFHYDPNDGWKVRSEISNRNMENDEPPKEKDRFQNLCRSIPTIRQSFGSFSSDRRRCDFGKGMEEFSLRGAN